MYERCVKRTFDFVFVVCILAIVWPILLLLAFWLYFANKGAGAFLFRNVLASMVRFSKLSNSKQ